MLSTNIKWKECSCEKSILRKKLHIEGYPDDRSCSELEHKGNTSTVHIGAGTWRQCLRAQIQLRSPGSLLSRRRKLLANVSSCSEGMSSKSSSVQHSGAQTYPQLDAQDSFEFAKDLSIRDRLAALIILDDARFFVDLLSNVLLRKLELQPGSTHRLHLLQIHR